MFHPLQLVPVRFRKPLLLLLGALCLIFFALQLWTGSPLRLPAAPQGIVSLELAPTPERAASIIAAWTNAHPPAAQIDTLEGLVQPIPHGADQTALTNLLLDFPFLLAYGLFLSAACAFLVPARGALVFSYLAMLAMLCDAFENTLLLRMLNGDTAPAPLCRLTALTKFTLATATLLYLAWTLRARRPLAAASALAALLLAASTILAL